MERQRKHGEEYVCKRWRMLTWLTEQGFKPKKTIPDAKRPDYHNWVFDNSTELEDAIDYYFDVVIKR